VGERCFTGLHVGDVHVGSMVAPCPEGFETSYDSIYQPNVAQLYLNQCWAEMLRRLPPLDYVSFGGDLIEGPQWKENHHLIWEPSELSQARAALLLLQPILGKLKPGGKVWYVRGTKYHVGEVGLWDEWLAERLGAEQRHGRYTRTWLNADVCGIRLDTAHRNSSMLRYRATPLNRELEFAENRCSKTGDQPPHGIIRHHSHGEYNTVGLGMRVAVECPAWQLQTEFAQSSISPNRLFSAHFGSVLAYIYPDRLRDLRRPVVWGDELLFKHPTPDVEVL
jgi:hypothetical protein